jgi:site-specific recombinase XerC
MDSIKWNEKNISFDQLNSLFPQHEVTLPFECNHSEIMPFMYMGGLAVAELHYMVAEGLGLAEGRDAKVLFLS